MANVLTKPFIIERDLESSLLRRLGQIRLLSGGARKFARFDQMVIAGSSTIASSSNLGSHDASKAAHSSYRPIALDLGDDGLRVGEYAGDFGTAHDFSVGSFEAASEVHHHQKSAGKGAKEKTLSSTSCLRRRTFGGRSAEDILKQRSDCACARRSSRSKRQMPKLDPVGTDTRGLVHDFDSSISGWIDDHRLTVNNGEAEQAKAVRKGNIVVKQP
jgi:hypothetical protein